MRFIFITPMALATCALAEEAERLGTITTKDGRELKGVISEGEDRKVASG